MDEIRRSEMLLAAHLSAVAGFVDAVGFMHLGGFFISFMSGNTTRMTANVAEGVWSNALLAGGLIGLFLVGVMAGAVVYRLGGRYSRDLVLIQVTVLLGLSALGVAIGVPQLTVVTMSLGMGAMNSVFERGGEVNVGLTYMTGTLVKAGQRFVDAFFGGPRRLWLKYVVLWAGLAVGSMAGALSFAAYGLASIWFAFVLVVVATAVTIVIRARRRVYSLY